MKVKTSPMESKLVNSCMNGDREAQYRLYSRYSVAMFNICLRILRKHEDAEDALQDAFSLVFRKMDTFRHESTLGAWIKRIVVNTCLNEIKKRKEFLVELEEGMHFIDEPTDLPENTLEVTKIQQALGALPDGYRTICSLYLFEGYDHQEIATLLDISVSTSKSQLHRGKKLLKKN